MLKDNINELIKASMLARTKERTTTLQLIKAEILKIQTAAKAVEYTEAVEISMLQKMVKQREDSVAQYIAASRPELATEEQMQIEVIKEFLPAEVGDETINAVIDDLIATAGSNDKKLLGLFMKSLKGRFTTTDGKRLSQLLIAKLQ